MTPYYQVYLGKNRVEAFRDAVSETQGEVLVYEGIPLKRTISLQAAEQQKDEEVWLEEAMSHISLPGKTLTDVPALSLKEPFVIKGSDLWETRAEIC